MIVVRNKIIPFAGFKAMAVWPFIFTRVPIGETTVRHETIHGRQQVEVTLAAALLFVAGKAAAVLSLWWLIAVPLLYYVWYAVEYAVRWAVTSDRKKAYHSILFEQEAYAHQTDKDYLDNRRPFAWLSCP